MCNTDRDAIIPEKLFRYMGIEGVLATLENGRIRYSAASVFDDKSECTFRRVRATKKMLRKKITDKDFLRNIGPEKADWVKKHPGKARRYLKHISKKRLLSFKDLKEELRNLFHIGCFTITAFSNKMWLNFAKDYSGACLEFKFHRKGCFHKINYSNILPQYSPAMCYDNGIHFMDILTHKREKFSWEQEYRYIVSRKIQQFEEGASGTDTYSDLEFGRDELIAVYIGCDISATNEEALMNILRGDSFKDVTIYKMKHLNTAEKEGYLDISAFEEIQNR